MNQTSCLGPRSPTNPVEMIEEWPHLRRKKEIKFSEFSSLYAYQKPTLPAQELYYTKSERRIAKSETVQEAARIRRLFRDGIEASEDVPTLAECGLDGHEVVGIEHLVLFKVPRKISIIRRHHSQMVLLEQERQRATCQIDPTRLSLTSAESSEKSSLQARKRADVAFRMK